MKQRTLMIATAVAALMAGTAFAQAPGGGERNNPASRNAPAEKIAPNAGGAHSNTPSNRMGQAPGSERTRTGQAPGGSRETTGQAPNERGNRMGQAPGERNNRTGERNERNNRVGEQNRNNKSQTTGQAPNERFNEKSNRTNNAARPNERNRSTTGQGATERGAMENRGATENRGGTRANVELSSEQRSRIHGIIVGERGAPRVGHVDFDVRVGTRVPRGLVHFARLPRSIIEIEPEWRGFEYFLVGDEIVVVDPASLEIVAVLPA